jgi:hypothetical protein
MSQFDKNFETWTKKCQMVRNSEHTPIVVHKVQSKGMQMMPKTDGRISSADYTNSLKDVEQMV